MDILIVEDDKVLSLMLSRMVERMGFNVCNLTTEGYKAVELALEDPCDLILMDIMLEDDLDGIEAYGEIRKHRDIPIIYITGNSDPVNMERAGKIGYHDYLIKPVIFEELKNSIATLNKR